MSERNRKIYHSILLILSVALVVGLCLYLQKNNSIFTHLKSLHTGYILILISLYALSFWLLGQTHKLPLRRHQVHLKFKEWYGLCVVGELFNMLLPAKGGTAIRMLYIKDKKGLAMREFLSMSFAIILVAFTFLGISGLIYCQLFLKKSDSIFLLLESVFFGLSVSGVILLFFTEALGRVFNFKRRYSPKKYLGDFKLMSLATLCWIGIFILFPVKIYFSFLAIGIKLNFMDTFEISMILLIVSLFQVAPGNLGIKELITAYIGKQYGLEFETALLASLVDRAILLLFLFPVGFYFYWQLFLEATMPKLAWPNYKILTRLKQSVQT